MFNVADYAIVVDGDNTCTIEIATEMIAPGGSCFTYRMRETSRVR
jgi:hypothetical protein